MTKKKTQQKLKVSYQLILAFDGDHTATITNHATRWDRNLYYARQAYLLEIDNRGIPFFVQDHHQKLLLPLQ